MTGQRSLVPGVADPQRLHHPPRLEIAAAGVEHLAVALEIVERAQHLIESVHHFSEHLFAISPVHTRRTGEEKDSELLDLGSIPNKLWQVLRASSARLPV